jgi:hypothetical protein
VSQGGDAPPSPHDDPEALLVAFLAALDERDAVRAAEAAWPLLGGRPAREVGDANGLARLLRNDRHRPLLEASRRTRSAWDRRERAARAELLIEPEGGAPAHTWLVSLALGADGRWTLTGLQREGFEV